MAIRETIRWEVSRTLHWVGFDLALAMFSTKKSRWLIISLLRGSSRHSSLTWKYRKLSAYWPFSITLKKYFFQTFSILLLPQPHVVPNFHGIHKMLNKCVNNKCQLPKKLFRFLVNYSSANCSQGYFGAVTQLHTVIVDLDSWKD